MSTKSNFLLGLLLLNLLLIISTPTAAMAQSPESETKEINREMVFTNITSTSTTVTDVINGTYVNDVGSVNLVQEPPSVPTPEAVPRNYTYPDFENYAFAENVTIESDKVRLLPNTTSREGHYWATNSFSDGTLGSWTVTTPLETTYSIIDHDGHKMVVHMNDNHTTQGVLIQDVFSSRVAGTVELWCWGNEGTIGGGATTYIRLGGGVTVRLRLYPTEHLISSDKYGGGSESIVGYGGLSPYYWHHLRISFNCAVDTFDIWVNGTFRGTHSFWNNVTSIDRVRITTNSSHFNYRTYIDAVDYSWDSGYFLNRNMDFEPLFPNKNVTGYYQSHVVELPLEEAYFWEKFEVDVDNAVSNPTLDQQQAVWNLLNAFGGNPAIMPLGFGQSFIPTKMDYVEIEVRLGKTGNPLDSVLMELYEFNGVTAVGSALASDVVSASQIPDIFISPLGLAINFTISHDLNLSRQYCFVLTRTGAINVTDYYFVALVTGNFYPSGVLLEDVGAGWVADGSSDLYFKTFYLVDSEIIFEVTHSADNITWDGWSTTYHQQSSSSRHIYTRFINTNLSRYMMFRVNLSTNDRWFLPTVYSVNLSYISYEFNYSILEVDEFKFNKSAEKVYLVNITLELILAPMPDFIAIHIYNITGLHWDSLSPLNNTWHLFNHNLTNYFNGSVFIRVYCYKFGFPITLTKNKEVLFHYDCYHYEEVDKVDLDIEIPISIHLDTLFYLNTTFLEANITLWNFISESWDIISLTLNMTSYLISDSYYNGSIIFYAWIQTENATYIEKILNFTVEFYNLHYYFEEIDFLIFTLPIEFSTLTLNSTITTNGSLSGTGLYAYNHTTQTYELSSQTLNHILLQVYIGYYNGSHVGLKVLFNALLSSPALSVSKNIKLKLTYAPPAPVDYTWLIGLLIGVGIAGVVVAVGYTVRKYMAASKEVKTVVQFN